MSARPLAWYSLAAEGDVARWPVGTRSKAFHCDLLGRRSPCKKRTCCHLFFFSRLDMLHPKTFMWDSMCAE